MNTALLKYLVELSNNEVDTISLPDLYKKFPNSPKLAEDLKTLKSMGFISILYASNVIDDVGVNQKALDYFK